MRQPGSTEKARLARDVAKLENELDKAMNLLGKTQRALVDVGTNIAAMHQSLLEMKGALGSEEAALESALG
ncbi:hypothetical protein [Tsuneonella sp. HG222]